MLGESLYVSFVLDGVIFKMIVKRKDKTMLILFLVPLILFIGLIYYGGFILKMIGGFFLILFAIAGAMAYHDYRIGKKK